MTFAKGCAGHVGQGQNRNPEGSGHRRVLEKGLGLAGHLEEMFVERGRRMPVESQPWRSHEHYTEVCRGDVFLASRSS